MQHPLASVRAWWRRLKAGADLEWQERKYAAEERGVEEPSIELHRVSSPDGTRFALLMRNKQQVYFIMLTQDNTSDRQLLMLQHCIDESAITISWLDSERLLIENRCNEFSLSPDHAAIELSDDRKIVLRILDK